MKIKMTATIRGSVDGLTVIDLVDGQEYTMLDDARGQRRARAYIAKGQAVEVVAEPLPMPPDVPDVTPVKKPNGKTTAGQ